MSPLGPFAHDMCGNLGLLKFGCWALGESFTKSVPLQSSVSPQICRRFSQCPISWVAVRPRLNGALAIPVVPKAVLRMTTPSVGAGPPANCASPSSPPASVQTHRLRYASRAQPFAPPLAADLTESSSVKAVRVVFVRVTPLVALPFGSFFARAKRIFVSVTSPDQTAGVFVLSGFLAA